MNDPTNDHVAPVYRFGDWQVEPELNRLTRENEELQLEARTMDVLAYLIEHHDRVVPIDELLDTLWSDRVVEQATVHRCINQLRGALGDDSRSPTYIQTIVRRGYRAVAPVERLAPAPLARGGARRLRWTAAGLTALGVCALSAAVWWWRPAPDVETDPLTIIAVTAFEDLSPDGDQAWLGTAMADALTSYLSRIETLVVKQVPRSAQDVDVFALAERFSVGSVVRGSVQRAGDEIRVTARLIDASDGAQLWSARYDRPLDDLFEVQRDVTREVVRAIEAALGVEAEDYLEALNMERARYGARDVRAYEAYRRALDIKFRADGSRASDVDLDQALAYNLEAVAIDPDYAAGWAGLGATYSSIAGARADQQALAESERAFARALELDPTNPIAIVVLIQIKTMQNRWTDAVGLAERAESLQHLAAYPRALYGYLFALVNLGRWDEMEARLEASLRGVANAPHRFPAEHAVHLAHASALADFLRDYDAALALADRSGDPMTISSLFRRRLALASAYRARGREQEAVEFLLRSLPDGDRAAAREAYEGGGWTGLLEGFIGRGERAGRECRASVELLAELGHAERMYTCLERHGQPLPTWTAPSFDAYRDAPRFQAVLEDAGVIGYADCCPSRPTRSPGP